MSTTRTIWVIYETGNDGTEYLVDVYPTRSEARDNRKGNQVVRKFTEARRQTTSLTANGTAATV